MQSKTVQLLRPCPFAGLANQADADIAAQLHNFIADQFSLAGIGFAGFGVINLTFLILCTALVIKTGEYN